MKQSQSERGARLTPAQKSRWMCLTSWAEGGYGVLETPLISQHQAYSWENRINVRFLQNWGFLCLLSNCHLWVWPYSILIHGGTEGLVGRQHSLFLWILLSYAAALCMYVMTFWPQKVIFSLMISPDLKYVWAGAGVLMGHGAKGRYWHRVNLWGLIHCILVGWLWVKAHLSHVVFTCVILIVWGQ